MSPPRLRVIVVDDHDVVHWGFRLLLGEQPWVARCLGARTGEEAVALTRRYEPHVALVDLFVGDESGMDISTELSRLQPAPRVILISGAGQVSPPTARAVGASGFLSKGQPAAALARKVLAVGAGGTAFEAPDAGEEPRPLLSPRERDVLSRIAAGGTNREIGSALHLSPHTVKEHASALYRKLGVRNRAGAVQRAERLGLLS